jgi:hypothetical protein
MVYKSPLLTRDNIKMRLAEIRWGHMDWIKLRQDRGHWLALMQTVMNFPIPGTAGKFLRS